MAFYQVAPRLRNTYLHDTLLRESLQRLAPQVQHTEHESLTALGELAAGELFDLCMNDQGDVPRLTHFDAWGNRVDRIELSNLWKRAQPIATQFGLVASAYDRQYGALARVHQFALIHLFHPSSGVATCPLAMTDGAAKTLRASGNAELAEHALPRLLSRDPAQAWTSGQWMTERSGGSDVGISETVAKPNNNGTFSLFGTKWFTSATTSQMALTLARPEGNAAGGSGLALFYIEPRDASGALNGITIHRLKDKLGTRHVPTAELLLHGAVATPVAGSRDGIKNITPMLAATRMWNAACAVAQMRRATDLAKAYAQVRVAFGAPLFEKPLHRDTLAGMEAESCGAFLFALRVAHLLGKEEHNEATEHERQLLRLATPILKLLTAKQGVAVSSEALEAFGGAGYVEDTGFPQLLRDAQVLPIWEGTTNVLSLDLLRAIGRNGNLDVVGAELARCAELAQVTDKPAMQAAQQALAHAEHCLAQAATQEQSARAIALTVGLALEVALLVEHAAYQHQQGLRGFASAAARRLVARGIDCISAVSHAEDAALLLS